MGKLTEWTKETLLEAARKARNEIPTESGDRMVVIPYQLLVNVITQLQDENERLKDEKKYIKYEEPKKYGGYVEVDDLDVDYSTIEKSMRELILEAKRFAVKESIKANSIILNKKYVKTPHLFVCDGFLPPMICGLEVYMTADELPDNYSFALLEKAQTERERLIGKTKSDTAREILVEAKKWVKEHYKDKVTDSFGEREMLFMEAFGCLNT